MLGAGAICAPENATKAMASLLDEISKLVKEGIPTEELEDAKESYALQIESQLADDGFVTNELNDGLFLGRTFAFHKKLYLSIQALKPEQVLKALQTHLKLDRLMRVKAGDLKD